ncbi:MAG: hypothetical protein EP310_00935 [Bacteroidetes bacterium]|nr:MAG: hypothetical protein EP310_00935 [Bacteroidota bacterium]
MTKIEKAHPFHLFEKRTLHAPHEIKLIKMITIKNIFSFFIAILLFSCSTNSPKKIFYINSYHAGYGSSDDVMQGITETLAGKNVKLQTFFMDTKRKSSEEEMQQATLNALEQIEDFQPDLLLVSDDNAMKYIIRPHFNNSEIPAVFCGVNWSAEQYHLGKNVTGMLEVLPLRECLSEVISNSPETKNLVVLSENSLSEQNNTILLDTLYKNLGLNVDYKFADDFETWKKYFLEANQNADLIYMPTNGAIRNWNESEAKSLVHDNLKIPAVTCDDFMMPYVVFGLTKVAKEQGEWAANTALEILTGKKPEEIQITKNVQTKAYLNTKLAEKLDFKLSDEYYNRCIKL